MSSSHPSGCLVKYIILKVPQYVKKPPGGNRTGSHRYYCRTATGNDTYHQQVDYIISKWHLAIGVIFVPFFKEMIT
nr:MAG TPA: hypothetical protein [Caudoviricetes sp.]